MPPEGVMHIGYLFEFFATFTSISFLYFISSALELSTGSVLKGILAS